MTNRRNFFKAAGAVALGASAVSRVGAASLPEAVYQSEPTMQPPLMPSSGRPYNPVATLNGWSLPWRMNQGVKEFHLVAEPVVREMNRPGYRGGWLV
jgi:manganese oxidase